MKEKHLEFIQNVIIRMANNSFLIKGWTITLVAAIIALSFKEQSILFITILFIVVISFWGLDGYYLSQERKYRDLYNHVRKLKDSKIDYSMNALPYQGKASSWCKSTFSMTLIIFYGLFVLIIIAYSLLSCIKKYLL
ncbi:MAG: hypothetical protein QM529_07105 [Hydrotalea sp.]|nr:hypothetical protein [Hydrotalea sp.]